MDIRKETLLAICRSKQPLFQPGPASPGVHLLCVPWPGPASLSPRHANALEGNQLLNSFPIPNAKKYLQLHSGRSINRDLRSILLSLHLWLTLAANPAPSSPTSHPSIKCEAPATFWTRREFFITPLLSEMFTHTFYMCIPRCFPRCSMRWKSLILTLSEGAHDQVLSFI